MKLKLSPPIPVAAQSKA